MIYGDLCIVPMAVEINHAYLIFWCNLTEAAENSKLSALLYKAIYIMYGKRKIKSERLANLKNA